MNELPALPNELHNAIGDYRLARREVSVEWYDRLEEKIKAYASACVRAALAIPQPAPAVAEPVACGVSAPSAAPKRLKPRTIKLDKEDGCPQCGAPIDWPEQIAVASICAPAEPAPKPAAKFPPVPEPLGFMSPGDINHIASRIEQYRGRNYNIKATVFLDQGHSEGSATDPVFTFAHLNDYARGAVALQSATQHPMPAPKPQGTCLRAHCDAPETACARGEKLADCGNWEPVADAQIELWQPIHSDDLSAAEKCLMSKLHERACFFPVDARQLADIAMHCIREVRAARRAMPAADATRDLESLAMMIRMLVSSLRKHWPHAPRDGDLPSRAMALLKSKGLLGSPLRSGDDTDAAMSDAPDATGGA